MPDTIIALAMANNIATVSSLDEEEGGIVCLSCANTVNIIMATIPVKHKRIPAKHFFDGKVLFKHDLNKTIQTGIVALINVKLLTIPKLMDNCERNKLNNKNNAPIN